MSVFSYVAEELGGGVLVRDAIHMRVGGGPPGRAASAAGQILVAQGSGQALLHERALQLEMLLHALAHLHPIPLPDRVATPAATTRTSAPPSWRSLLDAAERDALEAETGAAGRPVAPLSLRAAPRGADRAIDEVAPWRSWQVAVHTVLGALSPAGALEIDREGIVHVLVPHGHSPPAPRSLVRRRGGPRHTAHGLDLAVRRAAFFHATHHATGAPRPAPVELTIGPLLARSELGTFQIRATSAPEVILLLRACPLTYARFAIEIPDDAFICFDRTAVGVLVDPTAPCPRELRPVVVDPQRRFEHLYVAPTTQGTSIRGICMPPVLAEEGDTTWSLAFTALARATEVLYHGFKGDSRAGYLSPEALTPVSGFVVLADPDILVIPLGSGIDVVPPGGTDLEDLPW